jgi:hypothetical protein
MELFAVDEVKYLHHYERVEDESEVSRKYSELGVNLLIIHFSTDCFHTATSDCTPNDSLVPFKLWFASENTCVIAVYVFRDKSFTCEDQNHNHSKLENSLSENVFEHCC